MPEVSVSNPMVSLVGYSTTLHTPIYNTGVQEFPMVHDTHADLNLILPANSDTALVISHPMGYEVVRVGRVNGVVSIMERGLEQTTPQFHPAGSCIEFKGLPADPQSIVQRMCRDPEALSCLLTCLGVPTLISEAITEATTPILANLENNNELLGTHTATLAFHKVLIDAQDVRNGANEVAITNLQSAIDQINATAATQVALSNLQAALDSLAATVSTNTTDIGTVTTAQDATATQVATHDAQIMANYVRVDNLIRAVARIRGISPDLLTDQTLEDLVAALQATLGT